MRKLQIAFLSLLVTMICASCLQEEAEDPPYFLSDIRSNYFERLNFYDSDRLDSLPTHLAEFTATYNLLEESYKEGVYQFEVDIENMNLANLYYSSLLTAITKAYLDEVITFDDIKGDREQGLFSGITESDNDLERIEMEALAWRGLEVAKLGLDINALDEKSNNAYVMARHIYARLRDPYQKNSSPEQRRLISHAQEEVKEYDFISVWNLIKGLTHLDDYGDKLNTFDHSELEPLLDDVIERIDPETLPNLNNTYTSILAAVYLMDLVMKKVDWLFQKEELSRKEARDIRGYILNMKVAETIIVRDRKDLLESWEFKSTFEERQEKLKEIEAYFSEINSEEPPPKPQLAPFFQTRNFRQAYQCYSCHKTPNL